MDSEEKQLLKRLLKKVENLESELEKRDNIIHNIQTQKGTPKKEWGPLPKNDRLARLIVQKAREQVDHNEVTQGRKENMKVTLDELKKNFSFGELARFALKKRLLPVGKESSKVSDSGEVKVYED